jgi:hypothetical protein
MKLKTHQLIELNNKVYESMQKKEYDSLGTAIFEELNKMSQYLADKIKHSENDPFNNDKNIFKCLNKICDTKSMQYFLTKFKNNFGQQFEMQSSIIPGYPIFL